MATHALDACICLRLLCELDSMFDVLCAGNDTSWKVDNAYISINLTYLDPGGHTLLRGKHIDVETDAGDSPGFNMYESKHIDAVDCQAPSPAPAPLPSSPAPLVPLEHLAKFTSCFDPMYKCAMQLNNLCYSAWRASTGNCLVCAGLHQSDLEQAGCDEPHIDSFCTKE